MERSVRGRHGCRPPTLECCLRRRRVNGAYNRVIIPLLQERVLERLLRRPALSRVDVKDAEEEVQEDRDLGTTLGRVVLVPTEAETVDGDYVHEATESLEVAVRGGAAAGGGVRALGRIADTPLWTLD